MWHGKFVINEGNLTSPELTIDLVNGQFFRIVGSALNDGVYKKGSDYTLVDESFVGTVFAMAVPPAVVLLADDIEQWQNKYGSSDSAAMSPFSSESFGGYSYSKLNGSSSSSGGNPTWKTVFADRLNRWRKI